MEVKSEKKVRGKDQKLGSRWGVPGARRKIQPFSPEASDVVPDSDICMQQIQPYNKAGTRSELQLQI